jgi:hypothetical protein
MRRRQLQHQWCSGDVAGPQKQQQQQQQHQLGSQQLVTVSRRRVAAVMKMSSTQPAVAVAKKMKTCAMQ